MTTALLITFAVSIGANLLMFIPAYRFQTDKLTDISYAVTFVVLALYGLATAGFSLPNIILAAMIGVWAVRLGGFLLVRVSKTGRDRRFDERRKNPRRFLAFWLLQGLTVWVVSLPSIMFFAQEIDRVSNFAYIGLAVWALGFAIEVAADRQKYHFKRDPANAGKWIAGGLWKYSRHPNYFGEMALWVGVYIYALFGLPVGAAIAGALGPVFLILLIRFVSGVPILEKQAEARWGADPAYQSYKRATNLLIPFPRLKPRKK